MTPQSDLASVGYMLIELLSGKPIVESVTDPDDSTRSIGQDISRELLAAKRSLPDRLCDILPLTVLRFARTDPTMPGFD